MSTTYKSFLQGIAVVPKNSTGNALLGDIEVLDTVNTLNFHNGSSSSQVLTVDHSAQGTSAVKNKDFEDTTTKLVNNSDPTKKIKFEVQASHAISTTTLTLPDTTDVLVARDTTDTLTNKTLTSPVIDNIVSPTVVLFETNGNDIFEVDGVGVKLYDADASEYIGIRAPATTNATYTITLPSDAPNANTALVYDGADYKWSTAGGGDASGSNDDIISTLYSARILDTFEDSSAETSSSIDGTRTSATHDPVNQVYAIAYTDSATITNANTTTPTITVGGLYTLNVGDAVIIGSDVRFVTQIVPSITINAAFPGGAGAQPCRVSQTVATKELYQSPFDGAAISDAFNLSAFSEYLVDYEDNASIPYVPNFAPFAAYSASQDNFVTNYSQIQVRATQQIDEAPSSGFASAGTTIYLRFFNNRVGAGTFYLFSYRAYFQKNSGIVTQTQNQAYARFDGSVTPQNCSVSVVGGKSRVTLTWVYGTGLNGSGTFGSIFVYVNGQLLPRSVSGYITSGAFYREINANTIELDADYSATVYDVQILQST